MKHANVALFVPHNGCPQACSFCNQRQITGQAYQPTPEDVQQAVETALRTMDSKARSTEIAFFGGSFTAIDRHYMTELLRAAAPFVRNGQFAGIRISTRPDAIDEEILNILQQYGVTSIELGAQSMSERVLKLNRRGHTAEDVRLAAGLIRQRGISLGLQMMTGLYGSDALTDRQTAEALAALAPDTMRIYPTVVLRGTELAERLQRGEYHPAGFDETVELCADLLQFFEQRGIRVIRLGLHDSDSLRQNKVAGVYHPAFREICESEIMLRNSVQALKQSRIMAGTAEFYVCPASVSRFIGQKRKNLLRLQEMGITAVVRQDERLTKYEVRCRMCGG